MDITQKDVLKAEKAFLDRLSKEYSVSEIMEGCQEAVNGHIFKEWTISESAIKLPSLYRYFYFLRPLEVAQFKENPSLLYGLCKQLYARSAPEINKDLNLLVGTNLETDLYDPDIAVKILALLYKQQDIPYYIRATERQREYKRKMFVL